MFKVRFDRIVTVSRQYDFGIGNATNNNNDILLYVQAGLLCTNALMILNRPRFLAKYGLDDVNNMGCAPSEKPLKYQAIGLLAAVQYLKVPVIALNCVTMIFELLLGGS